MKLQNNFEVTRQSKMGSLQTCPICLVVPEREIYQCSEGHIICHLCIYKVSGNRCPQCRLPLEFGNKRVRSRVLEELLDSQDFECKLKDKGCTRLVKRGEITSHANWCTFNPDTVVLCQLLGMECRFGFGSVSRSQVIEHFRTAHDYKAAPEARSTQSRFCRGKTFKAKLDTLTNFSPSIKFYKVMILEHSETSPIFFMLILANQPVGFLSVVCVNIWGSEEAHPSANYLAKIKLIKVSSYPPQEVQPSCSSSALSMNPFPISYSMRVCSLKEAYQCAKLSPINIPIALLKKNRFGENVEDCVQVKISQADM